MGFNAIKDFDPSRQNVVYYSKTYDAASFCGKHKPYPSVIICMTLTFLPSTLTRLYAIEFDVTCLVTILTKHGYEYDELFFF